MSKVADGAYPSPGLDPGLTFDAFIANSENKLARVVAMAVTEFPTLLERDADWRRAVTYNPLVLVGPEGAGKTHLLNAIGNRVLADHPGHVVRYLRASMLVARSSSCELHNSCGSDPIRNLHSVDVLLVDDADALLRCDHSSIDVLLRAGRTQLVFAARQCDLRGDRLFRVLNDSPMYVRI